MGGRKKGREWDRERELGREKWKIVGEREWEREK